MKIGFQDTLFGVMTCAFLLNSGTATASAFALIEQSSGAGNAFAGGTAAAEDATTLFFNPAGMSRFKGKQVTAAGTFIKLAVNFHDTGSTAALLQSSGGNGGDAGSQTLLANTYVVMELNPALRFGLGIYAPFGLQTEYDPSWIGRFQAIKSRIQTINFNPSLSYQVNEGISLGIGVNHQRITGELSNAVNYSAAAYAADPVTMSVLGVIGGAGKEGVSTMTGSDSAWGYNFGALINVDPDTRIGMAYRSKIRYTLSGTVSFSAVPAALAVVPQLANGNVTLPISMPDSFSISGFHQMPNGWDVMADATWMGWSVLQQLKIDRTDGTNLQTVQENWKNTWRVSTGASYHYNDHWLARVGVAYDQTPVSSTYMTARIPDNNRTWATLGGQYRPSPSTRIDFSYVHIFVKDAAIANDQTVTGNGNLAGNYTSSVDTLSVQYAHSF